MGHLAALVQWTTSNSDAGNHDSWLRWCWTSYSDWWHSYLFVWEKWCLSSGNYSHQLNASEMCTLNCINNILNVISGEFRFTRLGRCRRRWQFMHNNTRQRERQFEKSNAKAGQIGKEASQWSNTKGWLVGSINIPRNWNDQRTREKRIGKYVLAYWIPDCFVWADKSNGELKLSHTLRCVK